MGIFLPCLKTIHARSVSVMRLPRLFVQKLLLAALTVLASFTVTALESPLTLAALYARSVDKQLLVPADETQLYGGLIVNALNQAGLTQLPDQYLMLVDRNRNVQALFIYWKATGAFPLLIGASPISTGQPGRYDYFETPTGVFEHTIANLDFRAEGTKNEHGIRGYGIKGMRVFDFGWQLATRGWGDRGMSMMRLQMHATDPDYLEKRLGNINSKGCIRIPASLNQLIDHYGLLDADYERAMLEGDSFWMLPPDRSPTPWSGRYLIIVDSMRETRPTWAELPRPP